MKSFDEFGFEKKSHTAENNTPLADDFITRRKPQQTFDEDKRDDAGDRGKMSGMTSAAVQKTEELALSEKQPEMTVMCVKENRTRSVTKPEEKRKNIFVTENVLEKKKKKFPFRTVMVVVFVFVLSFLLINQYVMVTEYSKGIAEMKNTLKNLDNELDRCETDLVVKNKDVEKYAKENGMISDKDTSGEYVEIAGGDVIEVFEAENGGGDGLASVIMSALGENFINAWNTLIGAE